MDLLARKLVRRFLYLYKYVLDYIKKLLACESIFRENNPTLSSLDYLNKSMACMDKYKAK